MKIKKLLTLVYFSLFVIPGFCQSTPAPLPPEAQEAVNQGIAAAKLPDFPLAIQHFEEARKAAPQSPVIWYYLGLAESKLPGRELRAICWFEAYLAANPTAQNAAAVKDEINTLDIKSQLNLANMIRSLQDLANLVPFRNPWLKVLAQTEVAMYQAEAGDIAGAQKALASQIKSAEIIENEFGKGFALQAVCETQAEVAATQNDAGDPAGAQKAFASALKTADLILKSEDKSWSLAHIVHNLAQAGEISSAISITEQIQYPAPKKFAQEAVDWAQWRVNHVPTPRVVSYSDWIDKLDDQDPDHNCALNTDPFLDLGAYLASKNSNDKELLFDAFNKTTEKFVNAQNAVDQLLKQ